MRFGVLDRAGMVLIDGKPVNSLDAELGARTVLSAEAEP